MEMLTRVIKKMSLKKNTKFSFIPWDRLMDGALIVIIASMCVVSCIIVGIGLMAKRTVDSVLDQAHGSMTVQVVDPAASTRPLLIENIIEEIKKTPGVTRTQLLTFDQSRTLLEPWLGELAFSPDLFVPLLIEVEINRQDPPGKADIASLTQRLQTIAAGTVVDNHALWKEEMTLRLRQIYVLIGSIFLLLLVLVIFVIISAVHAGMRISNKVVKTIHVMGAEESFVARAQSNHYTKLVAISSMVGYGVACLFFYALANVSFFSLEETGVEASLFSTIQWDFYGWLVIIPLVMTWLARKVAYWKGGRSFRHAV